MGIMPLQWAHAQGLLMSKRELSTRTAQYSITAVTSRSKKAHVSQSGIKMMECFQISRIGLAFYVQR